MPWGNHHIEHVLPSMSLENTHTTANSSFAGDISLLSFWSPCNINHCPSIDQPVLHARELNQPLNQAQLNFFPNLHSIQTQSQSRKTELMEERGEVRRGGGRSRHELMEKCLRIATMEDVGWLQAVRSKRRKELSNRLLHTGN